MIYKYSLETGQILACIHAPLSDIEHYPAGENEAIFISDVYCPDGYVENGSLLPLPESPSPHHEWDWTTKAWLPNLAAARESQRQAWNAWRDRELVAGHSHNGHIFHSDDRFMAELQLILKGYERGHLTGTSAIRTRDNAVLQMSAAEIESLLLLIGLHRQAIYQQSWVGKDALAGLTTLESIVAGGPPS